MKKIIILFCFASILLSCKTVQNVEKPLKMHKYPCGMSFAYYDMLPLSRYTMTPLDRLEKYGLILHSRVEGAYKITYTCKKEGSLTPYSIYTPDENKITIDGRECLKWVGETAGDSEEGDPADYHYNILCENNGNSERFEINIWLEKENNLPQRKEFAEKIISSISFK